MKKLNDTPGKNPFKVPENYFEDVNRRILSVTSDTRSGDKSTGNFKRFRPYLAIAASVAGFIIISLFTVKLLTVKSIKDNISEIITEGLPDIYLNEIDVFWLEENLATSSISDGPSEISNTEIIDYLISENIEINDIYDHL